MCWRFVIDNPCYVYLESSPFRRASLADSRVAGQLCNPLMPSNQKGWVFPGSVLSIS